MCSGVPGKHADGCVGLDWVFVSGVRFRPNLLRDGYFARITPL
jgi:hypothetical protein